MTPTRRGENPTPWRTGRHPVGEPGPRGRILYDAENEMVGAMDSNDLALRVTVAMRHYESHEAVTAEVRRLVDLDSLDRQRYPEITRLLSG